MGKKIAIKLKRKDKAVKAGNNAPKNIGGIFNAKVVAIANSLKNRK
jgi:hypothetical protein